jgi:hypothetical protein
LLFSCEQFLYLVLKKHSMMVKLEICITSLEFKSGRAPLVRDWDNRGFTHLLGPTKYAFQTVGFLE